MATQKAESLITATVEALDKGAGTVKPKDGAGLIKDWIDVVKKDDAAKGIADDLQALHDELGHKAPDAKKINQLVKKLGAETVKAASKAEGDVQKSLKSLGESLNEFATTIK